MTLCATTKSPKLGAEVTGPDHEMTATAHVAAPLPSPPWGSDLRHRLVLAALVAAGNYGCALLGYTFMIRPAGVSMVWPGSGFVLALLLLVDARRWPAVLLGAITGNVAADLQHGASVGLALGGGAVNALESLVAAALLVRFLGRGIAFNTLREVGGLIVGAAVFSNAATALLGAVVLTDWTHGSFWRGWFVWWTGDGMGMLIVAPAILTWAHLARSRPRLRPWAGFQIALMLAATVLMARAALSQYPYVAFPLLLWSAVRFGPTGAATGTLILTGITEWHAAQGAGPFAAGARLDQMLQTYVYLALASLSSLVPASILAERRLAERRLRESELRFRQMAEHINEAFFVVDLGTGEILYASPTWAAIWGRPMVDAYDRTVWDEAIHPDDRAALAASQAAVARGEPSTTVFRILRPDGSTRWVRGRAFPVRNESGAVYRLVGVSEDITQLRKTEERFVQAQKMEAVGRLAGGIAHDFNNLLTAIIGSSELLLEDSSAHDRRREDLEEIKKAGQRAAALTRQLLAFSRQQVLEPRVLDLNALIADLEKMLRRLIGEDVQLRTALAPGLGAVRADPGQLEQVIMNLTVNARDAMPRGGKVTIETANANLDDVYAAAHTPVAAGPYVMLAVSDTGTGMTPDVKAHLFEPFFTTKEQGKGTGLGLATVYGIVKQSDGYVWVYSEPGQGTTFKIYLPRVAPDVARTSSQPESPVASRGSETILVAEDEDAVRRLTRRVLETQGYTVLAAANGPDALRLAHTHPGPIHLLLTDVVMPNMSGRELAELVVSARPETKVLYLSGYTDDAVIRHGVLEPGIAFLQKPFTLQSLAHKLREVLDAG